LPRLVPHAQAWHDPARERVGDGHVEVLALLRARAAVQRAKDAHERVHGRGEVTHGNAYAVVGLAAVARERHHAGHARVVEVVPRPQARRASLAITADRAINEARVERAEARVIDAQARRDAGPVALDEHVGPLRELLERGAVGVGLEVEHDAFLAAVHGAEQPREHAARVVAAGALDLDHGRAHFDHLLRGVRAGQQFGQIEHGQARERGGGGGRCGCGRVHEVCKVMGEKER
jgi:hypothetical protein